MKRVNVPLMLVTLIASAAHAENNYCPSSPPTPFTQQLARIAVSRALPVGSDIPGTQRVFTFSGNCRDRSGWADVTQGTHYCLLLRQRRRSRGFSGGL